MTLRWVQVQGRDGSPYEFYLPEAILPHANDPLRLKAVTRPTTGMDVAGPRACNLQSFVSQNRDASNLVLAWLDPDSWLAFETACLASRIAVRESRCWASPVMGGHSLRFPMEQRKSAYVRHRRCVARVAKAFQVTQIIGGLTLV